MGVRWAEAAGDRQGGGWGGVFHASWCSTRREMSGEEFVRGQAEFPSADADGGNNLSMVNVSYKKDAVRFNASMSDRNRGGADGTTMICIIGRPGSAAVRIS